MLLMHQAPLCQMCSMFITKLMVTGQMETGMITTLQWHTTSSHDA